MKYLSLFTVLFVCLTGCTDKTEDGWSEDDKKKFLEACMIKPELKSYCECNLEKLMEKAPNYKDIDKVNMNEIATDCIGEIDF